MVFEVNGHSQTPGLRQVTAFILIAGLAIMSTACTDNSSGDASGTVQITDYQVSPQQLIAGQQSDVNIVVAAKNTGSASSQVNIGQDGRKVLTDTCPDTFSVNSFESRTTTTDEQKTSYALESGETVSMQWNLELTGGNIPLNGKKCGLKSEIGFNYSSASDYGLKVFRSSQALEASEPEQPVLSTSSGPIKFLVEPLPTNRRTGIYVAGEDTEASMEFKAVAPSSLTQSRAEIYGDSINVEVTEPLDLEFPEDCTGIPESPVLYKGETTRFTCDISIPGNIDTPSLSPTVSASLDYNYKKELPSSTVEVMPRPQG